jgi:peptidyl-prolyl cis-trans isomerase D
MAIIGKIREKSGLVATFVGIGLLAFIIPFNDLMRQFTGEGNSSIGLFNNDEINAKDWNYNYKLSQIKRNFQSQYQTMSIPPIYSDMLEQSNWQQIISDTIYYLELNKIGVGVSADELNQGLLNGENPLPSFIKKNYTYNGVYNKDSFNIWKTQSIINLPDDENSKNWLKTRIEDPLKNERIRSKYGSMLKNGVLNTFQEGKRMFFEENTTANVKYIFFDYNQIADSNVKITNESEKNYFNEHRYEKQWEVKNDIVSYDYITLKINPSSEDVSKSMMSMNQIKEDLTNSKNDTVFIKNRGGEVQPSAYRGRKFSSLVDLQIEESQKGDIIGPFINGDKIQLVKVYETSKEDQAKVRHILINSKEGDFKENENKKLADSILYAVKRDSSKFNQLVTKYSDDQGSVTNGGVYSWFPKGQMVPEFEKFSFSKRIGSSGIVKSQYGFHVIQVLGRREGNNKKIATITEPVSPSRQTKNQFYDSVALDFYYKADSNGFKAAADDMGFIVKSADKVFLEYPYVDNRQQQPRYLSQGFYGPFIDSKETDIAKWAFNSEIGEIMEPEYIINNQLVIAVLKEKIVAEDNRFNNLKSLMEPMLKNHLKAEYIKNKYKDLLQSTKSVDSISQIVNSKAENKFLKYSDYNLTNNSPNQAEPKVMAHIFNLKAGETSPIIEGKSGVYIVQLQNKNITPSITNEKVLEKIEQRQEEIRNQINQNYYGSLYNSYKVKDQRAKNMILNN